MILLCHSGLGEFVTVTTNGPGPEWPTGFRPHKLPYPSCQGVGANRFQRCFAEAISLPPTLAKVSNHFAKGVRTARRMRTPSRRLAAGLVRA